MGTDIPFFDVKTKRIGYSGVRSSVLYVSDPAQLPSNDAFAEYDEAFFQEHALVLVKDTVGSGSVRVGLERITVRGNTAHVFVSRKVPGQIGTADMAMWYIWAEVEKDLRLQWKVANSVYAKPGYSIVSK